MNALRFIGFAVVIVLVIAGLDYFQQDKKHEGTLSVSAYIGTFKARFAAYNEELDAEQLERERKKRWHAGGKPYMPETGDGWVRRAIVDREFTLNAREGPHLATVSAAARPLASNVAVQKVETLAKKMDQISWVYEKGEYTLWLQVQLKKDARSNSLVGSIAQSVAAMDFGGRDYAPFGVIGGVAYFQFAQNEYSVITVDDRAFWAMITATVSNLDAPAGFNIYKGTLGLGQEIRVQLYSDAPAPEVYAFLSQIDYEAMNGLLDKPVPGVANDAASDPESEAELAINMAALRGEFVKLRAELARMRLDNIDGLALVANSLAAQYGLPGDTFDLTANNIQSADDLVQVGYRKGLSDLLLEETQKADADGKNVLGRLVASFSGEQAEDGTQATGAQAGSGSFLGGLKSMFQKGDSAEATPVRVNKGGSGLSSKCSTKAAFKKCTLTGG
ncbi:hypothetical protein [Ruegeria meonggei]|uniref:Uncharacterized protein n=1 Tax=Ruegeria meonggei TaxID=1446476 RepID=A0A1X6YKI3_9RHOB|nr:hypothetical protein [Ruegeria meonggei]SLN23993.1 hypothetical protein RUM8411_00937 [Ruegeria meonggei]